MSSVPADAVVRTVLGDIHPSELGVTSAHEHVLCDLRAGTYQLPDDPAARRRALEPLRLDNLWWVREHHLESLPNVVLDETGVATRELALFREQGGRSVVDLTCHGLGPSPVALAAVSEASGVHVVLGCGHYIEASHPQRVASMTAAELACEMVQELTGGVDATTVRAGVIGEIGCSWPVTAAEHKVMAAAAEAHLATGAAVVVHTGRHARAGLEHVEELAAAGVDAARVVVSHVDRRIDRLDDALELAASGAYLAFDCFGLEPWIAPAAKGMPMPCDLERATLIRGLCDHGHGGQILIAQDIAMKHRLTEYGGHGYAHILRWGFAVLQHAGVSDADCRRFVVDNPRDVFWMRP